LVYDVCTNSVHTVLEITVIQCALWVPNGELVAPEMTVYTE